MATEPMTSSVELRSHDAVTRATAATTAGLLGPLDRATSGEIASMASSDPDPRVRAAALGALCRSASRAVARRAWRQAIGDSAAAVRRRAAELAAHHVGVASSRALVLLLDDADVTVVESSAWALGELGSQARTTGAVPVLIRLTSQHADPLAREAAVAALGAIGDQRGLRALLDACSDKPAVRRRAVVALAAFDGPLVEATLGAALDDPDWQVRQIAEDLTHPERVIPGSTP